MGVLSKVTIRHSAAATGIAVVAYFVYRNATKNKIRSLEPEIKVVIHEKVEKKDRAAVDAVFCRRMIRILKILVPGWMTQETWYLVVVALSLIARTYADVWMISNGTSIESAIIGRDKELFKKYLFRFIYAMPVISVVNNMLKYGLSELKLRFRTRLSHHLYDKYLRGFTYYKMSNLDNRISNADQLLTQDVDKFCDSVAELYSNLSKIGAENEHVQFLDLYSGARYFLHMIPSLTMQQPRTYFFRPVIQQINLHSAAKHLLYTMQSIQPILDVILYTVKLTEGIGAQGPAIMLAYLAVSGLILTRLRRPVGKLTVIEQKLEGEYRYVNSRLITNSEEIAFYQGNKREQTIILATFHKLVNHLRYCIFFKLQMGFIDNIVAKYIATVFGYLVVSRPFLNLAHPRHLHSSHSERLEFSGRVGPTEVLDGFKNALEYSEMFYLHEVFENIVHNVDYYKSGRMLVRMAEAIGRIVLAGRDMTRLAGFTARITELLQVLDDISRGHYVRTMVSEQNKESSNSHLEFKPGNGKIMIQDHIIRFEKVPLVTPNGDVLVKEMNFEVQSGVNVLVCGPNGAGKSSLFRILGELWPLFGGTLTKPDKGKLFYIPQRPYMTVGTLRDQVIYPDSQQEQLKRGVKDSDLAEILCKVQLEYIQEREGLDSVQDWMDVLSGGEKQRIAMARLFYHKPQFAILDECTSAVSVDVEGFMYQHCRQVGITLFTVSHRKSLWKHHEFYLMLDGRGNYEFKKITSDTTEFGS